eukprot:CAMPEP_0117543996 /NCGR_PEP_ID=MMETSP0784-20121206/45344_1 /TAXON_ID=39447 /ORGANISM="" /LENGTH=60 /DNA_ID=CAMNT_0005340783 /DNA_START=112 /DNA_END=291 /DNA_ORIENTATION=-
MADDVEIIAADCGKVLNERDRQNGRSVAMNGIDHRPTTVFPSQLSGSLKSASSGSPLHIG